METRNKFFFCGIGGSGMSAIAQVLAGRGVDVVGSDRNHDRGMHARMFANLAAQGIRLVPQDGSGVTADLTALIVSSAVEDSIPDVAAARKLGVPIRKRAELLADLFNAGNGVAVGGTSGKSTVTGMVGFILHRAGLDPTIVSGARMRDFEDPPRLGNAVSGAGPIVIEADESDGTIALYDPAVSVLTNISFDHKPLEELLPLFRAFCERATDTAVVNADCADSMRATEGLARTTFGVDAEADLRATGVEATGSGMRFAVGDVEAMLPLPGRHNVENALAAAAACARFGVDARQAFEALTSFKGTARRLEVLGIEGGVTVIDDFAHNPDKIAAALDALRASPGRLHVLFQPHGFGPTKMLREGLVAALADGTGASDRVWMPEIYYAGGTADKSISSADIVDELRKAGRDATFEADRETLAGRIVEAAEAGDRIVIMGARDDSLTDLGRGMLERLAKRSG